MGLNLMPVEALGAPAELQERSAGNDFSPYIAVFILAVERGPLVYCAEAVDNQNEPVLRAVMAKKPAFSLVDNYGIENTETKGAPAFSVKAIQTSSQVLDQATDGTVSVKNQKLTLIPYYAWNHRGANQMNVWFYQNLNVLDK